MGNNNPIKIDLDKFDEHVKAIRGVGERVVDDNLTCPEPSEFMAGNPIMQEYYEMQKAIIEIRKMKKAATLLLADRLQEISDNHRAINESATQRISADKVEHNAMPVSSKTQTGSSLNAPVSTMPKLEGGFRSSYKTGDAEVDEEIVALFEEYGDDLSGLMGCPLTVWDEFSETRKKALAQIYYTDMNLVTTQYPADTVRINAILTLLQNGKTETYEKWAEKAFDIDRLRELDRLVPRGKSKARLMIGLMMGMKQSQVGRYNYISVKQKKDGISFLLSDGLYESDTNEEIGKYNYPAGSCHYLYMDYLTENKAVNDAIEALFDKYGGDLSGLKDLSLSEWDNFSEEVKCAIACVYTVDMNNAVDNYSDQLDRLENILTLFQNGGESVNMAFNSERLCDLEKYISDPDCSAMDVLAKMRTMPFVDETGIDAFGHIRICQNSNSITFSKVYDEIPEKDIREKVQPLGLYMDYSRSYDYLVSIEKQEPGAFNYFKKVTGLGMEDMAGYVQTSVNTQDLNLIMGLLTSEKGYSFLSDVIPSTISSGCALKLADYSNLLLELSVENDQDDDLKNEYLNFVNAVLNNNNKYIDYQSEIIGGATLLDMMCTNTLIDSDLINKMGWATAYYEYQIETGQIPGDGININEEEIEKVMGAANMNASVWAMIRNAYNEEIADSDRMDNESVPYISFDSSNPNNSWDFSVVMLKYNGSSGIQAMDCINDDGVIGMAAAGNNNVKSAREKVIKAEREFPYKLAADAIICIVPKGVGVPIQAITSIAFGDLKSGISTVGKIPGTYDPSSAIAGKAGSTAATLINDFIGYSKIDDDYYADIGSSLDYSALQLGSSYTPNGIQVTEYRNMLELTRLNYEGCKNLYQIDLEEGTVVDLTPKVQSCFVKDKYTDEEVKNALNLIYYGETEAKESYWEEGFEYDNFFQIPDDLRMVCINQMCVSSRTQNTSLIDEFREAVNPEPNEEDN